jgi:hypothetical protein
MRRSLTEYEFRIAIMNEDPTRAEDGFYPDRTDTHLYNHQGDDDVYRPLAIATDYQASISPLVWCQVNDLVIPGKYSLNFLGSMYVKKPLGMKHVIDDFCAQHKSRPCKEVIYFYDHTAVGERNMHKKFYEEVIEYFEDNGWHVRSVYMGAAPKQGIKYNRINYYLRNDKSEHWPVRMHREGCASMIISMDLTETKERPGVGTEKDKSKETDKKYPQELTTHFSDVFDQLVWAIMEKELYPSTTADHHRIGIY